jgi:hypothetical protein
MSFPPAYDIPERLLKMTTKQFKRTATAIALSVLSAGGHAATIVSASSEPIGLYAPSDFNVVVGAAHPQLTRQAEWYFQNEVIAIPTGGRPAVDPTKTATQEVRELAQQWRATAGLAGAVPANVLPPLVWLGASQTISGVAMSPDGTQLREEGAAAPVALKLVPKLATNLSYYNARTTQFFQGHPLKLRGEVSRGDSTTSTFTARSIWPMDYIAKQAPSEPLKPSESLQSLVSAEKGGADASYYSRVLWSKPGLQGSWEGKAVMAFMLNGAQGDDDEAHGGHFAVVTGKYAKSGDMSSWLVNNFYGVNSFSEKGILAAPTPLDKYMGDLNNGQSFYRPSYMLVAVMKSDKVPQLYQGAIGKVFNHLYRHDMEYNHALNNCSGISLDTFRNLGWNIPSKGTSGRVKAVAAFGYVAATSGKLSEGRSIYNYLSAETTRLYPAVAFETLGESLLAKATGVTPQLETPFEKALGEDVEAIVFVRIPQFPSSRASGLAPVFSFNEYMKQAPEDRSKWKIVPTTPRPFPAELKDGIALEHPFEPLLPTPVFLTGAALLGLLGLGGYAIVRRGRK